MFSAGKFFCRESRSLERDFVVVQRRSFRFVRQRRSAGCLAAHDLEGGRFGVEKVFHLTVGVPLPFPPIQTVRDFDVVPDVQLVHVVARVPRPYATDADDPGRPPLAAGLFVEAEIEGRRVEDLVRVPREIIDDQGHLFVLDAEDRLRRRQVEVLRLERNDALVAGGLQAAERVSLLAPRLARDGLAVRPVDRGTLAEIRAETRTAS